eukprot:m.103437 g.103437  ORF g.103437 m.103437 type:complete len:75 (-) comp15576_c0_seq3:883-1107(-)
MGCSRGGLNRATHTGCNLVPLAVTSLAVTVVFSRSCFYAQSHLYHFSVSGFAQAFQALQVDSAVCRISAKRWSE